MPAIRVTAVTLPTPGAVSSKAWASRSAAQTLANSAGTLANQISVLDARKTELASEASAAHVLRGLHFAAQAHIRADKAVQEFEKDLKLQSEDIDSLELAASQCATMGQEPAALDYFQRLNAAAQAKNRKTVQARALRLSAIILERQSASKSWDNARDYLEAAIAILRQDQGVGQEFDPKEELTESLLLLGQVQTKRERYSSARRALIGARLGGSALAVSKQKDFQQRIDEALTALNQVAKDPDKHDSDAAEFTSEPPQPAKSATETEVNGTSS